MAVFSILRDFLIRKFSKNSSENYPSSETKNEYCIKVYLCKNNKINLDCIIPDITDKNSEEIYNKFFHLVNYVSGPTILNDIILAFGENIDNESNDYKVFLKKIVNNTINSNANYYNKQSENSQKPLVKPSHAIKNIMMSEMLNNIK